MARDAIFEWKEIGSYVTITLQEFPDRPLRGRVVHNNERHFVEVEKEKLEWAWVPIGAESVGESGNVLQDWKRLFTDEQIATIDE